MKIKTINQRVIVLATPTELPDAFVEALDSTETFARVFEYLNRGQTRQLMKQLNAFFETVVEVPRIRFGKRRTVETTISEEALLFAKFLRDERKTRLPRVAIIRHNRKDSNARALD